MIGYYLFVSLIRTSTHPKWQGEGTYWYQSNLMFLSKDPSFDNKSIYLKQNKYPANNLISQSQIVISLFYRPPPIHGSSTRGNSEESRRPTRKSPKNEDFFRIAYSDRPGVGIQKSLVDWLGKALKTRSCSWLNTWIIHAWEVFNGWWWGGWPGMAGI